MTARTYLSRAARRELNELSIDDRRAALAAIWTADGAKPNHDGVPATSRSTSQRASACSNGFTSARSITRSIRTTPALASYRNSSARRGAWRASWNGPSVRARVSTLTSHTASLPRESSASSLRTAQPGAVARLTPVKKAVGAK
jgi:hypothetical protein